MQRAARWGADAAVLVEHRGGAPLAAVPRRRFASRARLPSCDGPARMERFRFSKRACPLCNLDFRASMTGDEGRRGAELIKVV